MLLKLDPTAYNWELHKVVKCVKKGATAGKTIHNLDLNYAIYYSAIDTASKAWPASNNNPKNIVFTAT